MTYWYDLSGAEIAARLINRGAYPEWALSISRQRDRYYREINIMLNGRN